MLPSRSQDEARDLAPPQIQPLHRARDEESVVDGRGDGHRVPGVQDDACEAKNQKASVFEVRSLTSYKHPERCGKSMQIHENSPFFSGYQMNPNDTNTMFQEKRSGW